MPSPGPGDVRVVGRESERRALRALIAAAVAGRGACAVIEGEAGSGKSTVVDEAVRAATTSGAEVLRGAARELEQERPFGCVVEALSGPGATTAPDVRQLLRLFDAPGEQDARFVILDEIADLVEQRTARRPVVLALEDLHWSDPSSSLVLARLARVAPTLPLLTVATMRPTPRPGHLALALAAAAECGATQLHLEALAEREVHELAVSVLGRRPTPSEAARLQETGGNALFVVELLRAAESGEPAADAASSVPASLRLTLLSRVRALPGPSIDTLRIASVLGSLFSVVDLALLLGRAAADVARDLLPALDTGLLRDEDEGRIRFRHDLVRDAVYEDLPAALRASLHAQAARLLAKAGASPLDVAQHVVLGAVPGDPGAVDLLVDAAAQSRATAPDVAVDLLERALALTDPMAGREPAVHAELALALRAAGRPRTAAQQARLALASTQLPSAQRYALAQALCEALLTEGRTQELVSVADRAVADPTTDAAERAVYAGYSWLVRVLWRGEDPESLHELSHQIRAFTAEGDAFVTCFMTMGEAFRSIASADLDAAARHLHRALEVAERARLWREVVQVRSQRAFVMGWQDRVPEALEEAVAARRLATRIPSGKAFPVTLVPFFWAGAWDELLTEIDVRDQLAREAGLQTGATEPAIRSFLLTRAGDARARAELSEAEALITSRGAHGAVHFGMWTAGLLTHRESGPEAGLDVLSSAVRSRPADGLFLRLVGPDAVRFAVAAGRGQEAERWCDQLDAVSGRLGGVTARAAARLARGRLTADDALVLEAVSLYASTPARPDERADALAEAGARLRRADPGRAEQLLQEAVSLWRRLGAHADADAVAPRTPARTAPRPVTGWGSLTSSERRVVELLARGLRNKQIAAELFVSPRTVETHVSRALQKLQASSRVELAGLALQHLDS